MRMPSRIAACLVLAIGIIAHNAGAFAQSPSLDALAGHWVAEGGADGLPLSEITIDPNGRSVTIETAAGGASRRVVYEPADGVAFLPAENSATNPLDGKPVEWIRISDTGILVHRLETTETGGLAIITDELIVSAAQPDSMNYRRLAFRDGIEAEATAGTFTRGN